MPAAPSTRRPPGRTIAGARRALQFTASAVLAWYFFHLLGHSLLDLPGFLRPDAIWDLFNQFGGDAP